MFEFTQVEISQTQLVATALNVAGYLAASALSALVYVSLFNRRLRKLANMSAMTGVVSGAVADERQNNVTEANVTTAPAQDSAFGSGFVVIDSSNSSSYARGQSVAPPAIRENENVSRMVNSDSGNYTGHSYGRNRAEVIRLAREMLKAGNSAERVSDLLPVSESEMQLIRLSSGNTA